MTDQWLIIADDLTGAADCAIAFGKNQLRPMVGWGDFLPQQQKRSTVFSYNGDSRELTAEESRKRQYALLTALWSDKVRHFRKIDSTLRGQPAADIAATLDFLQERFGHALAIIAPAFPATGRITRAAQIFVGDTPLEQTELWRRDHSYQDSNMQNIIEQQLGIESLVFSVDDLRKSADGIKPKIRSFRAANTTKNKNVIIFDAEKQSDLVDIAKIFKDFDPSQFFVGSAGLAHALAAISEIQVPQNKTVPLVHKGGIVIAVGSLAEASRVAAKELVNNRELVHFLVSPQFLLSGGTALTSWVKTVQDRLYHGCDLLVEIDSSEKLDLTMGSRLAQILANSLKDIATNLAGFAATGGETASAFMASLGITNLCLYDEIAPGVTLGYSNDLQLPIITKAGAFGDRYSLIEIFDHLSAIRKKGKLV